MSLFFLSCCCLCAIYWSQMLSREWRCSWSSTDRQCSNYIWVVNKFITYQGVSYIRDLTVTRMTNTKLINSLYTESFKKKNVLAFSTILEHWSGKGSINHSLWKTKAHLSCRVNTMATDALTPYAVRTLFQYLIRHLIVRSHEVSKPRYWQFIWIIASLWNLKDTAAEVPVKFQSDRTFLNTNLMSLRFQTSYQILKWGSGHHDRKLLSLEYSICSSKRVKLIQPNELFMQHIGSLMNKQTYSEYIHMSKCNTWRIVNQFWNQCQW